VKRNEKLICRCLMICILVVDDLRYIFLFVVVYNMMVYFYFLNLLMSIRKFGGPQAVPGGAQPDPQGVYPPKGLSL
jgi:hypothetical protein